ncbi:helix-turn-helix domain-containing protein [Actinomadura sp. 21ATH]|uniref:helix-turn-helix domain-containing protein n=1 Tax=Actinomadura sp. 21ATH TaxID=1735444 RepID=UPI0035BFAE5D
MATRTKAKAETAPVREGYGTTAEVAEYTGFKVGTLRNWRWRGGGPEFTGRGAGVRYAWDDVERWMRERKRP